MKILACCIIIILLFNMTASFKSPPIIDLNSDFQHSYDMPKKYFKLSDYSEKILFCSLFALAYFFKLRFLWIGVFYITLKNALYWAATKTEEKRCNLTSSPETFYLNINDSKSRELLIALSNVFRKLYHMITPADSLPPPLFLSRSNTVFCGYGELCSSSLGRVSTNVYHQIRDDQYKKYFIEVSLCIVVFFSGVLYFVW